MSAIHDIFVNLNYISVFVMLVSYIIITRQTASHMQKLAMVVTFSLFVCCIGFLFRIEATTVEGLILGQKLLYSFVTFGMFYMLLFILDYCEYKLNRAVSAVFQSINAIITVVVLTLDHHSLFYKSYWLTEDGTSVSLEKDYGPFHTVAIALFALYMVAALVIAVVYSIHNIKRKTHYVWRLLFAVSLPCLSYVIPKVFHMKNDLQPIAFAAFTVLVLYMIYKNNLYDVDNIAAKLSIETLEEALVVLSGNGCYKGCNQIAKDLLPELRDLNIDDDIYGKSQVIDQILKAEGPEFTDVKIANQIFSVQLSPVNSAENKLIGKVIRLKDVTIERKYTELLKAQKENLTSQLETLSHISYTDDLTGCSNRRSYEEAVYEIRKARSETGITVWAADINGLKQVNDTKGHAAGDELIRAASHVLTSVLGQYGTVYRTGGDEFFALLKTPPVDNESLAIRIRDKSASWCGDLINGFSISYGYIDGKDCKGLAIDEIMILADKRMYEHKRQYYTVAGIDRRKQ